ncbi:hypothetical protein MLD38_037924 [Melastoma candidum]|uniref:Uncharacterized protein n=1 Tax=Melastoma candidum TaxID=119954 RepID=A0ACB9KXF6_9MYRT|nr:hypothetical protein MLD38_037924 [Melastoma candidum]
MTTYLRDIKNIVNQLAAIGKPVPTAELIVYTLRGLPQAYESLVTTLSYSSTNQTFDHISVHLLKYEQRLKLAYLDYDSPCALFTTSTFRRRSRNSAQSEKRFSRSQQSTSRSRNFSPSNTAPFMTTQQDPSLTVAVTTRDSVPRDRGASCQICDKQGHVALSCHLRFNRSIIDVPEALASMSINEVADDMWYPDFGVTDHMTPSTDKLHNMRPYSGTNSICIGDGARLPIIGIGQMSQATPPKDLRLVDVPQLRHHLLSVKRLCNDNDCSVSFDASSFIVKDRRIGNILLRLPTAVPYICLLSQRHRPQP